MDASKLIILLGMTVLFVCSCKQQKETADMDFAELKQECDMLRKDKAMALENNIEAQKLIDNIFVALNSLSGRIASLERTHEGDFGIDNRKKADEIAKDITSIKEKLDEAERLETIDNSTKIIISKLKDTIEQKEREVEELKEIIRQKDEQISDLDQQVSSLDEELGQKSQLLRESNSQLADTKERLHESEINAWIGMGDELISAATTLPDVKGHGNMKPVKQSQLTFIKKAIICYQKAQQLGSTVASQKISYAENLYDQKYRR